MIRSHFRLFVTALLLVAFVIRFSVLLTLNGMGFQEFVKSNKSKTGDKQDCRLCESIRTSVTERVRIYLPSPHSELLLGITLGINDLKMTPRFNDTLVSTGTIHVVVVSGYNVSLVFNRLLNIFKFSNRKVGFIFAQVAAVIYAVITGFDPPVVRALIMVSVVVWARSVGRNTYALEVFFMTVLIMLLFNPRYAFSISFQLSALATLGLIILSPTIEKSLRRDFGASVFISDFSASLSAQILVLPLISYYFGRINIISALINSVVLWLIPLLTISGMVLILVFYLPPFFALSFSFAYLIFSSLFINIIYFAGRVFSQSLNLQMNPFLIVGYYLLVFSSIFFFSKNAKIH